MSKCVFCEKFDNSDATVMIFEPLNPVTEGHMLVVPRQHVSDFTETPIVSARVMEYAAEYAEQFDDVNLITSKGTEATQTVMHMHVHIVPRRKDDGLQLPWSNQDKGSKFQHEVEV